MLKDRQPGTPEEFGPTLRSLPLEGKVPRRGG